MLRGICTECGTTKTQFVKNAKGGDLVGSLNYYKEYQAAVG